MENARGLKLSLDMASGGTVHLDGFDLSPYTSAIEYKAQGGKLAVITITLCADVEADLSVLPEGIRLLIDKVPEDKTIEPIEGKIRHLK